MSQNFGHALLIIVFTMLVIPVFIYIFIRMGTVAYFDGKFRSIKKNLNGDTQCQRQETDEKKGAE